MKLTAWIAGLTLAAGAAMADPVEGMWQTQPDEGNYAHIKMVPCGEMICGVIARSFNAQGEFNSPNTGKTLVINMVPQGDGKYEGKVWRPSNDKIYMGKMQHRGNQLDLSGCVAGGLLCSKQTWTRVN